MRRAALATPNINFLDSTLEGSMRIAPAASRCEVLNEDNATTVAADAT
jgi:hypothetical protein